MSKTFIIAELGINHGGDVFTATQLVAAAAKAGANACKFQTYTPELLDPPGPRREMLKRLMLSREAHFELKAYAESLGMEFISTPFDVPSLRFLVDELKVKTIKIASGHLENEALLFAAMASRCRLLISTGMADTMAVDDLLASCSTAIHLTVLHCVSAYPVPITEINLRAMLVGFNGDGAIFETLYGISDHTTSLTVPALAVALGATVVEKHLTLDRNAEGPDHRASLEPDQFRIMVDNIREAELALGDGVKRPQPCEAEAMKIMAERKAWREQLPTA